MQDWGFLRDSSSMEKISMGTMNQARKKKRGRRQCKGEMEIQMQVWELEI